MSQWKAKANRVSHPIHIFTHSHTHSRARSAFSFHGNGVFKVHRGSMTVMIPVHVILACVSSQTSDWDEYWELLRSQAKRRCYTSTTSSRSAVIPSSSIQCSCQAISKSCLIFHFWVVVIKILSGQFLLF